MISVKRQPRKWLFILGSAIVALALLSACGDSTATNIPAAASSTTAAANSGTSNAAHSNNAANPPAGTTPGANGQPGGAPGQGQFGGPGQGQFGGQLITGTIQSYDATSKALVVKNASGTTEQLSATNAVLVKDSKLTTDQLSQLLTDTTFVSVQGDKASDGTYTARDVTVMNGNIAGQFGGNGGFRPGQGANGTPGAAGANGSPRAGRGAGNNGGTPPADFTPGAGGFRGGQGANGGPGVILRGAKFADGKLTGTNPITNEAVTVVLSNSTVLTERSTGNATDLKAGLAVTVRMRATQNNPAEAVTITYSA